MPSLQKKKSLGELQEEFARDLVKLISYANFLGYEVRIGEVLRTKEQQEIYVAQGLSRTHNSLHLDKLAADLHFRKPPSKTLAYPRELGNYWESLSPLNKAGMLWVSFKDYPHFEKRKIR